MPVAAACDADLIALLEHGAACVKVGRRSKMPLGLAAQFRERFAHAKLSTEPSRLKILGCLGNLKRRSISTTHHRFPKPENDATLLTILHRIGAWPAMDLERSPNQVIEDAP